MGSRPGVLVAGVSGVLGFVLTIIGALIAEEFDIPQPTEEPAAVVAYYQALDFERLTLGLAVEMLGYLLIIVFSVKLAHALGTAPGGSGWGGLLVLTGVIMVWTLTFVGYAPWIAGSYRASHGGLPDDGYLLLNDLQAAFYPLFLLVTGASLLPAGILIIRTKLYPHWFGWTAVILAPVMYVVGIVAPSALRIADTLAVLWALWLLVAAVLMLRWRETVEVT